MDKKIRWGIIGLGGIANKFATDLALVEDAELVAVASRSKDRAEEFGRQFKSKHTFDSYLALFECDEVDVVYIATPHTSHKQWSIEAMKHGKHVLCEKPAGINQTEVKEMVSTARENKVFLMEALWSRFNPAICKTKEIIESGAIGNITHIHADFAFYALDRPETHRVLNPNLAGGSLLDIGIYPIFLSYLLLGKPDTIVSSSNFYRTGAEVQTSMIFTYANAQALLYSGLTSNTRVEAEISGNKGTIYLPSRWHEAQGYSVNLGASPEFFDAPITGRGYAHEIDEVHACLRAGKLESSLWSHRNSLDLIGILDTVRHQNRIVFPSEE